jgi:hypothetical protein
LSILKQSLTAGTGAARGKNKHWVQTTQGEFVEERAGVFCTFPLYQRLNYAILLLRRA